MSPVRYSLSGRGFLFFSLMKQLLTLIMLSLLGTSSALSQHTLCIHQKKGGVVSYALSEKPVVTYVKDQLHLTTSKVTIDYPLSNLEKLTFDDQPSAIDELRVEADDASLSIYRLDGSLVQQVEASALDATSHFDISTLPAGTYIIKHGSITHKLIKQ